MKSEYAVNQVLTPAHKDNRSFRQRLQFQVIAKQHTVSENVMTFKTKAKRK